MHGDVMLIGAQRAPQLISTLPSPSKNPPVAQPDASAATAAEAAPPQAAPLSHTGPQDAATAASVTSEVTQLLQKMTGDIANLEQAMEQLKAKQDQIANDNTKAIEQLKTKQEDMEVLLNLTTRGPSCRCSSGLKRSTENPTRAVVKAAGARVQNASLGPGLA